MLFKCPYLIGRHVCHILVLTVEVFDQFRALAPTNLKYKNKLSR